MPGNLVCSMSTVGNCGDNAACEGFFDMLKRKRAYRTKYPALDAALGDVFEPIERFHNPRMRRRIARQDLEFSTLLRTSVEMEANPAGVLDSEGPQYSKSERRP